MRSVSWLDAPRRSGCGQPRSQMPSCVPSTNTTLACTAHGNAWLAPFDLLKCGPTDQRGIRAHGQRRCADAAAQTCIADVVAELLPEDGAVPEVERCHAFRKAFHGVIQFSNRYSILFYVHLRGRYGDRGSAPGVYGRSAGDACPSAQWTAPSVYRPVRPTPLRPEFTCACPILPLTVSEPAMWRSPRPHAFQSARGAGRRADGIRRRLPSPMVSQPRFGHYRAF